MNALNDIDDRVAEPLEQGLSLHHWVARDPNGAVAAVRNAVDKIDLIDMALDMLLNPAKTFYCPQKWQEHMDKLLAAEANRNPQWVQDWQRGDD